MMRLDKFLAEMGAGTRQEVKACIRKGKVTVENTVITKPEYKVDETKDNISLNGEAVTYVAMEYFMLYKPAGVVSATCDSKHTTVIDLVQDRKRKDLFPVGRLDKDTEGLLLITNDGALTHRLLAPGRHVAKVYYARIRGVVTEQDVKRFAKGVDIGCDGQEEWTRPGSLEILKSAKISDIRLTIYEGKYHQVKRMFQAVGKEVLYLKREAMGKLWLDESMKPGEYRALTNEELEKL